MTDIAKPWAILQQYSSPMWRTPDQWVVAEVIAETPKTLVVMMPNTFSREKRTHEKRHSKEMTHGRYDTEAEARAVLQAARETHADVTRREAAVKEEMAEAMRPFRQRLEQLGAERADTLAEKLKGTGHG